MKHAGIAPTIIACAAAILSAPANVNAGPTLSLSLTGGQVPVAPGGLVQVRVSMSDLGANSAAGFQAFLHFDTTKLTFINGSYASIPFGLAVIAPIAATPGGDIDLAAGINQFSSQMPSSADAVLAFLTFQSINGACEVTEVQFRPHSPPSRLSALGGSSIVPLALVNIPGLPVTCPPDGDHDDDVDIDDLLIVINNWGICPMSSGCCPGDIDLDHDVDVDDLLAVILGWGLCPP